MWTLWYKLKKGTGYWLVKYNEDKELLHEHIYKFFRSDEDKYLIKEDKDWNKEKEELRYIV